MMTEGSVRCDIAGFEVEGMGPLANKHGWRLEARIGYPRVSRKECCYLQFSPVRLAF